MDRDTKLGTRSILLDVCIKHLVIKRIGGPSNGGKRLPSPFHVDVAKWSIPKIR